MFNKKRNILRHPKIYNPPAAPQKKGELSKFFKIFLILVIFLGGLVYLLFFSPLFQVKNVVVDSAVSEANSEFEKLKGRNILTLRSADIEKEIISQFGDLANLKIVRGLPDTLKIQLEARQSKMVWQVEERNYLVDSQGLIIKEIQGESDLPKVKDNKNLPVLANQVVASEIFLNFIVEASSKFPEVVGSRISSFEVNETIFQVDALTDQGWKVIFDTTRSVDSQLSGLKQFLSEHKDEMIEYADVRIEGKVYYK